jgi:alpha-L-glutamate ligase-like protein
MIKTLRTFKKIGLLGMNERNCRYTLIQNPRELYPLVDDKLITKRLLEEHRIRAPKMYGSIQYEFEMKLLEELGSLKQFVIKPARGAEGRGILVLVDKWEKGWKRANGEMLTREDLAYHISNILGGLYSLGGVNDKALIEYCVESHEVFRPVAFQGVPDVRVILYRGVPVMSMLRLPTRESGGRANLHQGAVGAGVNMLEGKTLGGVHHNLLVENHPDMGAAISGIQIPYWEEILETATRTFEIFKLGYLGVDLVIDNSLGPLILELNARPGLNIQLANREGLLPRLNAVDSFGPDVEKMDWKRRLDLSRQITNAA